MTAVDHDAARRRFEGLVSVVYEPVQRYLRRRTDPATADDVLGDVLLVLWRRLDAVPAELPLPYAYAVARGCLANSRRATTRQERVVQRLGRERPPPDDGDDDDALAEALEALPEADREVLRLWAWEQLPPRELALVLGISANAAAIRLHRAKQKLKDALVSRKNGDPTGHSGSRREGGGAR